MTPEELKNKSAYTVEDVRALVQILRGEGGCPWDREQTHASIRRDMLEEAYEAAEAIDADDDAMLREELGDVLFQVVFHACLGEEEGRFTLEDLADGVCRKMIERHPHVFGDVHAADTGAVLDNWEQIKRASHRQKHTWEAMEGVAKTLPALMRAGKMAKKAAKAGLYEPDAALESLSDEEIASRLFALAAAAELRGSCAEELLRAYSDGMIRTVREQESKREAADPSQA